MHKFYERSDMSSTSNSVVAVLIFLFVAINFLFPCNRVFPFDRRTTSVVGALMCYISRTGIDNLHAVNFDVMILLSSIMCVNHIIMHLKETKDVILLMQQMVQSNPIRGLWIIGLAAYITSPFLTNDGVCLLYVEPILNAFEHAPLELIETETITADGSSVLKLRKADAIYFLLALACSANIGSALTYTGNPQNMIVSTDAVGVMPSYKFLLYMLPASLFSWVVTMKWIQRCWLLSREHLGLTSAQNGHELGLSPMHETSSQDSESLGYAGNGSSRSASEDRELLKGSAQSPPWYADLLNLLSGYSLIGQHRTELVLSPRRKLAQEKLKAQQPDAYFVVQPFPHAVPLLLGGMIIMIFVGTIPISGTVCVFAVLMIVTVVLGNHLRGQQSWVQVARTQAPSTSPPAERTTISAFSPLSNAKASSNGHHREEGHPQAEVELVNTTLSPLALSPSEQDLGPMTREDEVDNLNQFFGALYGSIDYNVLLIFLGLFIVIANLSFTGIPKTIWNRIVGNAPFQTFASVLGICVFVVFASQFLGNVPVIQLAKPNVEGLGDDSKRLAWALLSFVSTVAGNLTLTGSAANIIVAETAARLDASMCIDFFRHFHVCFWITALCCTVGALMITAIVVIDNTSGSNW